VGFAFLDTAAAAPSVVTLQAIWYYGVLMTTSVVFSPASGAPHKAGETMSSLTVAHVALVALDTGAVRMRNVTRL
jgi:hypothetical protein